MLAVELRKKADHLRKLARKSLTREAKIAFLQRASDHEAEADRQDREKERRRELLR